MPRKTHSSKAGRSHRDAYHHGDLRSALIEATEALLAERGLAGFSLREVARRSGVSPAAPAHHFGDAEGLLTAVATHAFEGLTGALEAGNARGGADPVARLREQGVGYVEFALRYPGRFGLMFRTGVAGVRKDAALEQAAQAAFAVLEDGVRALLAAPRPAPLSAAQWQALLAIWSIVHGFAHLAIAGQLDRAPPPGVGPQESGLRAVLAGLLEQQLRGLQRIAPSGARRAPGARRRAATSGSR
jgi:AcrR family transcriptional regulator